MSSVRGYTADDDPLRLLADALRVTWKPRPLWWILQLVLWAAPPAAFTCFALLLPDPARAVALTIMGAFVGVQLAGPYRTVSRTIMREVEAFRDSNRPVLSGMLAFLRFYGFDANVWTHRGTLRLGHAPFALPFERARYRRRFRQCRKYFAWFDTRVWILGVAPTPAGLARQAPWWAPRLLWEWRQRRVLGLLARDLIRATSDWSLGETVDTVARANGITYRTAAVLRRNVFWAMPRHRA